MSPYHRTALQLSLALLTAASSIGCDRVWRFVNNTGQADTDTVATDAGASSDLQVDAATPSCLDRWMSGDLAFDRIAPLDELNTADAELEPFLTSDQRTIYFDSNRSGGSGSFDVYQATRGNADDPFGAAVNVGWVNTPDAETRFAITDDGLTTFLSARWLDSGLGNTDIWIATRDDPGQAFGDFVLMPTINTADHDEYDPFPTADGRRLYFSRQAIDAGPSQLWFASRVNGEIFADPAPVDGLEADSTIKDANPTLDASATLLVFSTNRDGGPAGTDLFYSIRSGQDSFGTPLPVPQVNSDAVDAEAFISRDGCTLYFASTRVAERSFDIYRAQLAAR